MSAFLTFLLFLLKTDQDFEEATNIYYMDNAEVVPMHENVVRNLANIEIFDEDVSDIGLLSRSRVVDYCYGF